MGASHKILHGTVSVIIYIPALWSEHVQLKMLRLSRSSGEGRSSTAPAESQSAPMQASTQLVGAHTRAGYILELLNNFLGPWSLLRTFMPAFLCDPPDSLRDSWSIEVSGFLWPLAF